MASSAKGKGDCDPQSRNKHLRPFGKRKFNKSLRKKGQFDIHKQTKDTENHKPRD